MGEPCNLALSFAPFFFKCPFFSLTYQLEAWTRPGFALEEKSWAIFRDIEPSACIFKKTQAFLLPRCCFYFAASRLIFKRLKFERLIIASYRPVLA